MNKPTTALQFSGGKDSLACLYLLRPVWQHIYVVWVNSGAAYPETVEQMAQIRALVPHFIEVNADQPSQIAREGFPSDLVPISFTRFGQDTRPQNDTRIQPWVTCCRDNLWIPLHKTMLDLGITTIIRGQKTTDYRTAPLKSGSVIDGIEYLFPIEDWTDQDVMDYLIAEGVTVPAYYEWSDTSLDCTTCTAYLDERRHELWNMQFVHPEIWKEVEPRLRAIAAAVETEYEALRELCP